MMLCTVFYLSRANIKTRQQEVLEVLVCLHCSFQFWPKLKIYEVDFSKTECIDSLINVSLMVATTVTHFH